MQQKLSIKGLYTDSNELSSAPEGALAVAKNIDILSNNVARPRRGFDVSTTNGYSSQDDRTDKVFFYQGYQFSHHGTYQSANDLSYYDSGWSSLGTYSAPSGRRMSVLEANQNLYFTTSAGVKKLDAYNSTPESAGVPKALNIALSLTGSSGWLEEGASLDVHAAYRVVWAKYDANDNLVIGAPSGRQIITNTYGSGTDYNVGVTVYIPDNISTSHFCQVYRSVIVEGDGIEPNDELQLVYEVFPDSSDISNGYLTFTDVTPESLRGAALYTNASQEGLAYQNEQPPLAKDIAVFRDSTFYANTTSKHRYYLTLLSASAMSNDETISIDGVTYTAKSSETASSGYFQLYTSGSASQNIANTAKSLVNVINQYASSTTYAYYLSSSEDLPGKMLIEERGIGGSAFAVTASDSSYLSPAGIPTSGSTEISSNDLFKNGLAWSKPKQSEHVPLVNQARVGSEDAAILRVISLKDSLIIFKEDGIYRLTGYYPTFDVELLDSSAKLVGHQTPSILNNEIFCLTDLGICKISDGVQIISVNKINQDLIEKMSISGMEDVSFGQGYETDKKYYLFLPGTSADSYPTFAYVYNLITSSFTKHHLNATCSVVNDKTLYYGSATNQFVLKERKNYSYLDYADYGFISTLSAINGSTLTLGSGVDNVSAGDIIYQSDTIFSTVVSADTITNEVVVSGEPGFTVSACTVLKAIDTEVKWTVFADPSPGISKQYHTAKLFFQESFSGTGLVTFSTDLSPSTAEVILTGQTSGAWGLFPWGQAPWGGVSFPRDWTQWVSRGKQRCSQMNVGFKHANGFSSWKLTGMLLLGETENKSSVRRA